MAFTKFAYFDADVLEVKGSPVRQKTASLDKVSDFENYRTSDGYMYVRIRAISSRVNKNHDGWPSVELAGSKDIFDRHQSADGGFMVEASEGNPEAGFRTFVGKPIFVDHNNSNPRKARGVIVDSKFRVLDQKTASGDDYWKSSDVDPEHLPASEIELLLEVDANSYPKFAKAIKDGDLDGFSMGCNVEKTKCSHCGKVAYDPADFCSHVMMKGAHHDYKTADGKQISKKSYENCYGCQFFEISGVFDPADETALAREVRASVEKEAIAVGPAVNREGDLGFAGKPDPMRDPREGDIEAHALWLQNEYGYDPEQALALAQDANLQKNPLPGHGEGEVYSPKRVDYMDSDPNGMPRAPQGQEGFPPPRRLDTPDTPFAQEAQEALDEAYPDRPQQNDPRWSSTKTAENPLPQEFMTKAPENVDTLRDEKICPICGSEMKDETCPVCGYVEPPKEFDNPDLSKAKEIEQEMKQEDAQQAGLDQDPAMQEAAGDASPQGQGGPLTSRLPSKSPVAASVTNDMRWTPKVHPKTAARINQVEQPVRPRGTTSNEPTNEIVLSDQNAPVTSAMQTARRLMALAQQGENVNTRTADGPTPPGDTSPKTRVDVTGVGAVDEGSNEAASKADAQVDVKGVGGVGVTDVNADKTETLPEAGRDSDDSGFNTDKTTDDSGPTSTYGDKDGEHPGVSDPVTNETLEQQPQQDGKKSSGKVAYDDNTLEQSEQQGDPIAQGGSAVQGVQPADSVATDSYKRVNLLEHQTTPANNSGETSTWTGTDGNGVLKQQDPVTKNLPETGGVPTPDVTLHTTAKARFVNAQRLAEAEVELGLIDRESKWNRFDELERMDPVKVSARLETLAQVKTAGLAKLAQTKTAKSFPRAFGKQTAASHDFERIASEKQAKEPVDDNFLDSALFS